MIAVVQNKDAKYHAETINLRPSENYPEYVLGDISNEDNLVYDMIRQGFRMMRFDEEHFGTNKWNPLSDYVKPGDHVVIKPNLVFHENKSGFGMDCLVTNVSVIAAIIDYVLIALKEDGQIIVGDAPLQECVFDVMANKTGLYSLIDYYRGKTNVPIILKDFRNVRNYKENGVERSQDDSHDDNGLIVTLNEHSQFFDMDKHRIERLRVTDYDPREMRDYHSVNEHKYCINKDLLDADVIFDLCKPKTHRKSGITASLKNFVGTVSEKCCLPHHTIGSAAENGDAYLKKNIYLEIADEMLDIRNKLSNEKEYDMAKAAHQLFVEAFKKGKKSEKYFEGSWYGNDTIWRTIIDLNRIMKYADKKGEINSRIQRRIFAVGDMIVSGEKEGPLCPSPIYPGVIVMGEDLFEFDKVVCSLMGFEHTKIPLLNHPDSYKQELPLSECKIECIVSNNPNWDGKSLEYIKNNCSLGFTPTEGWAVALSDGEEEKNE